MACARLGKIFLNGIGIGLMGLLMLLLSRFFFMSFVRIGWISAKKAKQQWSGHWKDHAIKKCIASLSLSEQWKAFCRSRLTFDNKIQIRQNVNDGLHCAFHCTLLDALINTFSHFLLHIHFYIFLLDGLFFPFARQLWSKNAISFHFEDICLLAMLDSPQLMCT